MLNLSTESADRWAKAGEGALHAGQLGTALQFYEKALTSNSADARALAGVYAAGIRGGPSELAAAISILQRAVANGPTELGYKLAGVCLYRAGRLDEALSFYQKALSLGGERDPALLDMLGIVYMRRGEPAAAAACFRRAIAIKPDAVLQTNLGAALLDLGDYQQAHAACTRAVEMNPSDVTARNNLGMILVKLDRFAEAIKEFEIAITLRPADADIWCSLGVARGTAGDACGAIAALSHSLELKPSVRAESHLLFAMHEAGRAPAEILARARRWDEIHGTVPPVRQRISPRTDRPLRVGYLSGDFRKHPVATFIAPLLQAHHRDAVEVFCYSHVAHPDRMTAWLQSLAPNWRDIGRLDDARAAEAIAADQIDVLVDLAGHCSGNRLGIVARRPAPVQITYLGYPGTTGLRAIGYRLTCPQLDPPGETEAFCSEKLLRLSGAFAVYGIPDTAPPVSPLPMERTGFCRFASFSSRGKVGEPVLRAWARILARVEGSRLDLYTFEQAEAAHVHEIFALYGIAADRVRLLGRLPIQDYFAAHGDVDILLDTFPLSGHTVICHGLWMGVPAVTLRGRIYWERLGSATMEWAGLREFIAHSPEEYVEIAVQMAKSPALLAQMRAGMRDRLRTSPLLDYETQARQVEAACRTAWTEWAEKNPT